MADFAMAMKKKLADINVHSFNDFKMKVGKWNTLSSINSFNSLLVVSEVRAVLANAVILVANCIFITCDERFCLSPKQKGIFAKQESSCSFVKLGAQCGRRFVVTT